MKLNLYVQAFVVGAFILQALVHAADDVDVLRERIDNLEHQIRELKDMTSQNNEHKRLQPVSNVVFSAVLDRNMDTTSHNTPVKYDNVYTNLGNGYDKNTGVFIPPANGLYQLFASVAVDGDDSVHALLEKNGTPLCACTATHYSTGSCMVIVSLEVGDKVWVREVYGVHVRGAKLSVFTGIMLVQY